LIRIQYAIEGSICEDVSSNRSRDIDLTF